MRNSHGFSLATVIVGLGMSSMLLLASMQMFKTTNQSETRISHQSLVSTTHALHIQQVRTKPVLDFMKAEITGNPELKACFSEAGGTNCNTASFAGARPLNVPGSFATPPLSAPIVNASESLGPTGPCGTASSACLLRIDTNYRYVCQAAEGSMPSRCNGAEIEIATNYLGDNKSIEKQRLAAIQLSKAALLLNQTYDQSCIGSANLVVGTSVSEGSLLCGVIPANECLASAPPIFLRLFGNSSGASTYCQPPRSISNAPGGQGYKSLHVYGASPSAENFGIVTSGYCSGQVAGSSIVVGKAVDKTRGSSWGGWSGAQAGKPYPCTIDNNFHLNLPGGGSGGVSNSCPPNYTSYLLRVSGTSFFKCSKSNSHVHCKNESKTPRDMDTIAFQCRWNG